MSNSNSQMPTSRNEGRCCNCNQLLDVAERAMAYRNKSDSSLGWIHLECEIPFKHLMAEPWRSPRGMEAWLRPITKGGE